MKSRAARAALAFRATVQKSKRHCLGCKAAKGIRVFVANALRPKAKR